MTAARQTPPSLAQSLRQAAALADIPGFPAEAVLCVRHLPIALDTASLRHAGGLTGAAEKLSRQLQIRAGTARRPALERVSDDAESVRFDNPAEMLACAARDWLDGEFAGRWWWRSLMNGGALAPGIVALWQRHIADVPAALFELDTRAEEFCRRLSESDAETLVARLIERHALPSSASAQPAEEDKRPGASDPRLHLLTLGRRLAAPLASAPRTLAAHRAETASPPSSWPNTANRIARQTTSPQAEESVRPDGEPDRRRENETRSTALVVERTRENLNDRARSAPIRATDDAVLPPTEEHAQHRESARTLIRNTQPDNRSAAKAIANLPTAPLQSPARNIDQTSAGIRGADTPPTPVALAGKWIETGYGGVLYLLNVAIHLGFYPDFTQPHDAGLALSPWTLIALIGERLAGRRLRNDALWTLLTTLAKSDAQHAGAAPEMACPPPSLPASLFPDHRTRPPNLERAIESWSDWLDRLQPPLRHRLAAALGVPPRLTGRLLCRQRARIHFRAGRLDAHFSLNEHPVALRLAGLDRDPGWMPSARCDIRLHYD